MSDKLKGLWGGGSDKPKEDEVKQAVKKGSSDKLKGLWGGGSAEPEDDVKKSLVDFSQRFVDLDGDGIPDEEVRQNFKTVLKTASPEQLQRATASAIQNLPDAQRNELAQMLQDRQQGRNLVDIQRTGETTAAQQDGGDGQAQGGLDDLLGGLLGGGGGGGLGDILGGLLGGGGGSSQQGGGSGGGLGDILGGLLGGGGGSSQQKQSGGDITDILGGLLGGGGSADNNATQGGGGGLGDLLSGPLGKMIMGGIAAYATKEMLGK